VVLKIAIVVSVILVLVLLVSYLGSRRVPRLPADLQGALEAARRHFGVPAMAGCVVTSDRIEADVGSGGWQYFNPHASVVCPVSVDDYWHIGSNTKAVTATLAGILIEEGNLRMTDRLEDAFGFELHADYADVTLRDLLEHRAGIAAFTAGAEFDAVPATVSKGTPPEQRLKFAQWLLTQAAAHRRGEFVYSNAGYGVAAALMETKSSMNWEELLQEKLFSPLGMSVRYGWPATAEDSQQPHGHWDEGDGLVPLSTDNEYELPAALDPAGDLCMPIGDYAKFLQLHLRGLRGLEMPGRFGQPILKPETIKLLHTPRKGDYSCGWNELRMFDLVEASHDGSAGTFYITATIDVDSDVAVAVVTNAGNPAAERAVHRVARRMLDVAAQRHVGGQAPSD
jgi:CubicO group peptidase (beta-lactamase class C family)